MRCLFAQGLGTRWSVGRVSLSFRLFANSFPAARLGIIYGHAAMALSHHESAQVPESTTLWCSLPGDVRGAHLTTMGAQCSGRPLFPLPKFDEAAVDNGPGERFSYPAVERFFQPVTLHNDALPSSNPKPALYPAFSV